MMSQDPSKTEAPSGIVQGGLGCHPPYIMSKPWVNQWGNQVDTTHGAARLEDADGPWRVGSMKCKGGGEGGKNSAGAGSEVVGT